MRFDGPEYDPEYDRDRLTSQHIRVRELMRDGAWRTLEEIAVGTGDPVASISAQLRHLRKARFGSWIVDRRSRDDRTGGLFEYRVLPGVKKKVKKKCGIDLPAFLFPKTK